MSGNVNIPRILLYSHEYLRRRRTSTTHAPVQSHLQLQRNRYNHEEPTKRRTTEKKVYGLLPAKYDSTEKYAKNRSREAGTVNT